MQSINREEKERRAQEIPGMKRDERRTGSMNRYRHMTKQGGREKKERNKDAGGGEKEGWRDE